MTFGDNACPICKEKEASQEASMKEELGEVSMLVCSDCLARLGAEECIRRYLAEEDSPSRFNEKLAAFEKAACELLETMEKEDHTGDYFIEGYPFRKSFEEIVHDIIAWRDKQSEISRK